MDLEKEHQPKKLIESRGQDASAIIGRMVGLQPHRHGAGQTERVAEFCDHTAFARHQNEILVAHQF